MHTSENISPIFLESYIFPKSQQPNILILFHRKLDNSILL